MSGKRSRSGPKLPPKEREHWLDSKIESARRRLANLKFNNGLMPDWAIEARRRDLQCELAYALHWKSDEKH